MEENLSFGYWVRRRRKALDLTQAKLGRLVSASEAMIRKIEADERRPSAELAQLLAVALAVPAADRDAFLRAARHPTAVQDLPIVTSPLAQLPPPSNLPAPLTSLVNRVAALAELSTLLRRDGVRLLTILGPPGMGKTRLAVQAARHLLPYFKDGAWFVDLSATSDPTQLLLAIARALELPPAPGVAPRLQVQQALRERQMLLILDNFEQLVGSTALEVADLLRAYPHLKILVTSRLRLDIYGEHEYPLPPMTLPPAAPDYDPADLQNYEAVQLFLDRARQHQPGFALSAATAVPIAEICRQMEGLPLALELAAARLRRLPVDQLAQALRSASGGDWHALLHTSARDLPPRQRTLFAAIAWSDSLLPPQEQAVLRQLAVFERGFDAPAAAAVCLAQSDGDLQTITAVLQRLVDHNLLSLVSHDPQRWRLLEMIREFALSQQDALEFQAARVRHARHFVTRRRDWYADWSETAYLATIDMDLENYRAALQTALQESDAPLAYDLAVILGSYHERRGQLSEGRELLSRVLGLPGPVDPHGRFAVLLQAATLAWMAHDFAASETLAAEAIALTRSTQMQASTATMLNLLGRIYLEQGRYEEADRVLLEGIELSRSMSPPRPTGMEMIQRGEVALVEGRLEQAAELVQEGLDGINETALVPFCMGWTNLAEVALARRDAPAAREALDHVLPLAHLHARRARIFLTAVAGYLLLLEEHNPTQSQTQVVAQILSYISATTKQLGDPLSPLTQAQAAARTTLAQSRLVPPAWQAAWEEGGRWSLKMALDAAGEALQRDGR